MIKKLLLTFSFIVLATIAFSGTTYMSQAGEKITVSEELANTLNILKNLYNEGVITEEEFSSAKSMLLDPVSTSGKKTKKNLTAAERKQLKEAEENKLKAQKMLLREEAKAEREKIKQASLGEKERIKQANLEEKERIKQANLEEKEKIKAEKALRKAEKKRLKAEWKKACSEDPESKACKEGKPIADKASEKVKKSLLKIKKKLGELKN
jgi:type IV secretory pathway VirB10-like protein